MALFEQVKSYPSATILKANLRTKSNYFDSLEDELSTEKMNSTNRSNSNGKNGKSRLSKTKRVEVNNNDDGVPDSNSHVTHMKRHLNDEVKPKEFDASITKSNLLQRKSASQTNRRTPSPIPSVAVRSTSSPVSTDNPSSLDILTSIDGQKAQFHQTRDSLLSTTSGFLNYRGILNLCIILLVMSSGRLVLENMLKYGFLVRFDAPLLFVKDPTAWPAVLAISCSNVFIYIAISLERRMSKNEISDKTGILLSITNIIMTLLLPAIYLWYRETNPLSSAAALISYSCLSMKLFSYLQVNKTLRGKRLGLVSSSGDSKKIGSTAEQKSNTNIENPVEYPNNLNFKDMYYFMFAPTLCYELNFPRTKRIRVRFLIRRLIEVIFLSILQLILLQQWIIPIIQNSQVPFRQTNVLKIVERLLKLAVPNHVIWLIMFYAFFHSYLNFIGELLRFGDREFYRDWWNAETVAEFWKNWNVPVHAFCSRHIYKPLLRLGLNKYQASVLVFFVSAFFHEYLVSIPLRMFRLWSFFGMVLQIPFAAFVNKFLHGNYGNMAVWVSLIIGQPIAIMMYLHDYYLDYFRQAA